MDELKKLMAWLMTQNHWVIGQKGKVGIRLEREKGPDFYVTLDGGVFEYGRASEMKESIIGVQYSVRMAKGHPAWKEYMQLVNHARSCGAAGQIRLDFPELFKE